jgi:hypothetical protein
MKGPVDSSTGLFFRLYRHRYFAALITVAIHHDFVIVQEISNTRRKSCKVQAVPAAAAASFYWAW